MESGNGEAPIIGQDDYGNSRSDPVFVKVLAVSIEVMVQSATHSMQF